MLLHIPGPVVAAWIAHEYALTELQIAQWIALALVVSGTVVLLWNWHRAPYRQRDEAWAQLDSIAGRVDPVPEGWRTMKEAIARLVEMRKPLYTVGTGTEDACTKVVERAGDRKIEIQGKRKRDFLRVSIPSIYWANGARIDAGDLDDDDGSTGVTWRGNTFGKFHSYRDLIMRNDDLEKIWPDYERSDR